MARVVHFEIQVDDVERARAFYAAAFDWTFQDWSGFTGSTYWGIMTGPADQPGINGGLLRRAAAGPPDDRGANAFVCTIQVEDYDRTQQRILDAGGRVAVAKAALGGTAWQGYFRDTEGNIFGIHQSDPQAR